MSAACDVCKRNIPSDGFLYCINPDGGYGQPAFWACADCLRAAEPGSLMAEKRDTLYPEVVVA